MENAGNSVMVIEFKNYVKYDVVACLVLLFSAL